MAATARFAADLPIASRSVSTPIPTYVESETGSNGRSKAVMNPMSRTFTTASSARTAPATTASARRGPAGSSAASATTTRSSRGSRANAPTSSWLVWFGATTAAQTSTRARTVSATAAPVRTWPRSGASSRRRHSHHTHSPTDAASAASATTRSACIGAWGRTPAAATVSTIPCAAATTLRQRRGGSGARIHGTSHSPTRNRYRAAPIASTQAPYVGAA